MHSLDPQSRETTGQRIDKEPFKPATAAKIRNQLRSELGSTYKVISDELLPDRSTPGRGEQWTKPSERS